MILKKEFKENKLFNLKKEERLEFLNHKRKDQRAVLYYSLMETVDRFPQMHLYDICFVCRLIYQKQREKYKKNNNRR